MPKNVLILMGSPRKSGNTQMLVDPFTQVLKKHAIESEVIRLYDKKIGPCIACRTCQKNYTKFGCFQNDDVQEIFDKILKTDIIILATPIYSWYCTPPMKALLDRLVYGMNKYYGAEKGPSLWENKKIALISTCGYKPEKGADLWEEGIKRYCKHSKLIYFGMLCERDLGYNTNFMDDKKEKNAIEFAEKITKII